MTRHQSMPGLASTRPAGRPKTISAATDRVLEAIRRLIVDGEDAVGVIPGEVEAAVDPWRLVFDE
jgi:hypothetical protein